MLLPFKTVFLTNDMKTKALRELGESDEVREKAIAVIKAFVKGQSDLFCPEDKDSFFLPFLRKAKFDIPKAKTYLGNFFRDRKAYPEIFRSPVFSPVRKSIENGSVCILPFRDQDGCAILVIQIRKWDPDEISFSSLVLSFAVVTFTAMEYEPSQVCGIKLLIDGKDTSWRQLTQVQIQYLNLVAKGLKSSLPLRIKGIHVVHEALPIRIAWNIISLYAGEKIRKRTHLHGNGTETLLKYFHRSALPLEYGGTLPNDSTFSTEEMEMFEDVFNRRFIKCYKR